VSLGYGHPRLVGAIAEQAATLAYCAIFYGFSHPQAIRAAERLAALTPGDLDHVFFTSGGSEAIESALSLARLYWARRGRAKTKVVSRYLGYHGNTAAAMSATGMPMAGSDEIQRLVPGHVHVDPPYPYRAAGELDPDAYARRCADELAAAIEREGAGAVAAFVAEPVLGVGGYIAPPPAYWPLVREVCDAYDVLLVLDEVMTGFLRTGRMFACEHWGLVPDLLVLGKGITSSYVPCGAVAFGSRVMDVVRGALWSGFTSSAHPLATAAVNAALDAYAEDGIAANVAAVGELARARLADELARTPAIGEVDGLGLMLGIELVADRATRAPLAPEVVARIGPAALERGLLTRGRGSRMAFCPPLVTTPAEAELALDRLHDALRAALA
jgi:putrescine aminotransferase